MSGNQEVLQELIEAFPTGDAVAWFKDEKRRRAGMELLNEHASPDFVCMMAGPGGFNADYPGPEGFFEAWDDWLAPFEGLDVQFEEMIELEDQFIVLIRQTAVPRGTTATVDNAGAAVLKFQSGKLTRAEFHLDRDEAWRSAGIDPRDAPAAKSLG